MLIFISSIGFIVFGYYLSKWNLSPLGLIWFTETILETLLKIIKEDCEYGQGDNDAEVTDWSANFERTYLRVVIRACRRTVADKGNTSWYMRDHLTIATSYVEFVFVK